MNDKEFRSLNFLKLKYRRKDQIFQPFCRIGPPQKLDPPTEFQKKFQNLKNVLLNHVETNLVAIFNEV